MSATSVKIVIRRYSHDRSYTVFLAPDPHDVIDPDVAAALSEGIVDVALIVEDDIDGVLAREGRRAHGGPRPRRLDARLERPNPHGRLSQARQTRPAT
ncbi:hypothetical protein [Frankia sp. AgKG'84/4]|uniref:hypothetical protein n=1 Tax=Frankia sp. AgKG'84/4 TaxID=573490 RepID=UPI00200EDCC4|nr:hypothetical protein [Frankia sp. AgKG'84/4]MCL9794958.1 hypothetical protein [Frankia sp. AgKG'84/4]